jgi:hypothetical protein
VIALSDSPDSVELVVGVKAQTVIESNQQCLAPGIDPFDGTVLQFVTETLQTP